jgi:hypothetical protein
MPFLFGNEKGKMLIRDIQTIKGNGTSNSSSALLSISGLILWLDAKDPFNTGIKPTQNTNAISTWKDKSGLNNDAIAYTNGNPNYIINGLNSLPAFNFGGVFFYNNSIRITNDKITIFVVGIIQNSNGQRSIVFTDGGAGSFDYESPLFLGYFSQGGVNGMGPVRSPNSVNSITPDSSKPYVFDCWFDGAKMYSTVQVGNTTTITNKDSSGNFGISYYAVGHSPVKGDNYGALNGYLSEILVYNTSLSDTDRKKIEGYLSWKWNLNLNLPTTHPYYNSAP